MLRITKLLLIVLITSFGCKNNGPQIEPEFDQEDFFYASDQTGSFELWHWLHGSTVQLTSGDKQNNFWPRSNFDRSQILYISTPAEDDIQNIQRSELHILSNNSGVDQTIFASDTSSWKVHASPSWSTNGDKIVFSGKKYDTTSWQLIICDVDGKNPQIISQRNEYDYFDPIFTNDDSTIICAIAPSDETPDSENLELFKIDVSTGQETRLTNNQTRDQGPSINSTGDKVIFESLINPTYLSIGKWAILELDVNTGEVNTLIEDIHLNLAPRFGNSDLIYFTKLDITEFKTGLYKYDRSTNSSQALIHEDYNALNIEPK